MISCLLKMVDDLLANQFYLLDHFLEAISTTGHSKDEEEASVRMCPPTYR